MTHPEMVRRLVQDPDKILDRLTPERVDYMHACLGIVTEAGELADACKKVIIYQQNVDYENLMEELGDLEFYMEQLRQCFGISREETLARNVDKLAKRYPGLEYSNEAAKARRDKVTA